MTPQEGTPAVRPYGDAGRERAALGGGLEVEVDGRTITVHPGRPFVIGRDERADLQLVHPFMSRRHLVLLHGAAGWEAVDASSNGVFVDGQRLERVLLTRETTVCLGAPSNARQVRLRPSPAEGAASSGQPSPDAGFPAREPTPGADPNRSLDSAADRSARQGRLSALHHIPPTTSRVTIGRAEDNDVVLTDLLASRHHAELRHVGEGWELIDLDSANGTYVNGCRIGRVSLGDQDVVGIGRALLYLDEDRLVERLDDGAISFRADGLVVRTPKGKQLLDHVGFSLEQKSLLAVVGPSGAGKSTLLRALTGFRPADEGAVHYAGRDLYRDYDELRQRIGLVPQDDILHPQLTVRRALRYAARLRFPAEVSQAERDRRIGEVIDELGLAGQADQRIDSLSGGQRKRTSVALELLTRPSLLFLDEPTSGLDPGLDKSVMRTLRELADGGRTVVVVTHSVSNLSICDRLLLLAPGGTVAYFGPPEQALAYFGQADFADLFLLLEREPETDWAERYRRSPLSKRYGSASGRSAVGEAVRTGQSGTAAASSAPRQQSATYQFGVLSRRYVDVIAADRQYSIFMAVLPLLLSLLAHALPGTAGLSMNESRAHGGGIPNALLLVFVVGAALMGSAASIRELVKEREIFRRERAIGLSRGAYLASKLLVLSVITGLQAVVLGVLGNLDRPAPDQAVLLGSPTLEIVVSLVAVATASMAVGLAASALIQNADRGMPLLVLLAMMQFILSSALLQISARPPLEQLSWLVPARWGFAMGASTIGLPSGPDSRTLFPDTDPLWAHASSTWALDLAGAAGVFAFYVIITLLLLRRLDPRRSR